MIGRNHSARLFALAGALLGAGVGANATAALVPAPVSPAGSTSSTPTQRPASQKETALNVGGRTLPRSKKKVRLSSGGRGRGGKPFGDGFDDWRYDRAQAKRARKGRRGEAPGTLLYDIAAKMEKLEAGGARWAVFTKQNLRGDLINETKHLARHIRRAKGLASGRAWKNWRKAANRFDKARASILAARAAVKVAA